MSTGIYSKIDQEIQRRVGKYLLRELQTSKGIDFCSNDYLGLSKHLKIREGLKEGIDLYGAGSTASRLVRGHYSVFEELESQISQLTNTNSSLFVANGFIANLGLLDSIADSRTIVFTDRLNHASILDGIRIAQANKQYHNHLDMDHLERNLIKFESNQSKIIVAESIYSMDGDRSDIARLVELKNKYNAILILDETHAFGVEGLEGAGLGREYPDIDFKIFTMGKALGLEGGIIACKDAKSKSFLINCMRSFVFSTATLPAIAYAGLASIEIMKTMAEERSYLTEISQFIRETLISKQYSVGSSSSQIIPVIFNSEEDALNFSRTSLEKGYDLRAIRPPSVPTPRIRISVHSNHSREEIKGLLNLF
jgi:8-amino-7-oxononanoate synthase